MNNLSLFFLDLDDFKKINDAFGHLAGDAVLKSVARLLKGALRSNDLIGRWGGRRDGNYAGGHLARVLR